MPSWPATLPQIPLRRGYTEQLPNLLLHRPTEVGPGKVRRRTTANVRPISWTDEYTAAQIATLESFYLTTLAGGALAFDYVNPRTGAPVSMMFVPGSPPTWRSLDDSAHYEVTIQLWVLP